MKTHGTDTAWREGCRCEPCGKAHTRAYNAKWFQRAQTRTPPTHGLNGYKNYGCRCEVCGEAGSAYNRANYLARKARR